MWAPAHVLLFWLLSGVPSAQALIDAPGLVRQQINYKRLSLTDIVVEIPKCPKKSDLKEALKAAGTCAEHTVSHHCPGLSHHASPRGLGRSSYMPADCVSNIDR